MYIPKILELTIAKVTHIRGILNAFDIGNICRQRIKENDFTPTGKT